MPHHKIYQDDCLKIMTSMESESVDLVFTDPPYAISNEIIITRGRNKMKFKGKDISHDFGNWDKFESLDDFMQWTFSWIDETTRILRPGGMMCFWFDRDKINFASRYLQDKYGFKVKGYYADLKSNPVPQARKVKWMNGWEEIGMWQKPSGKLTYNYQLGQQKDWGIRPIVGHTTKEDGERCHPTQKPIKVAKLFIKYWSNETDIILDPFAGSGVTAIACEKLNRNSVSIERETKYVDAIVQRLTPLIKQLLLDRPPSTLEVIR